MVGGDIYNATPIDVAGQWASRIAITVVAAGAAIYDEPMQFQTWVIF
jgi:hypothetical protein